MSNCNKRISDVEKTLFGYKSFLEHTLEDDWAASRPNSVSLLNGTDVMLLDVGVLKFTPPSCDSADSILISAAVHGNETAPIELLEKMVREILSGELLVNANLLIVLANPPSIKAGKRFIEKNMNRLFGNFPALCSGNNYECIRADTLMKHSETFFRQARCDRYHYDLHTAIRGSEYQKFAISPNKYDRPGLAEAFSFLHQADIEAILLTEKNSNTYSAFTSRKCGAISFTIELGKVKPYGQNNLDDFQAIYQSLTQKVSKSVSEKAACERSMPALFEVADEVIKLTENFRLCFTKDIANFTAFENGELLAKDTNYRYHVRSHGMRIIFPNQDVAIGHRALVVIQPLDEKIKSTL